MQLMYDLISAAPLILLFVHEHHDYSDYYLLIYFRSYSLRKNLQIIEKFLIFQKNQKHIVYIFQLLLSLLCIFHLFSCLWYGIAYWESTYLGNQNTWINKIDIMSETVMVKYIYALYFIIVSISSTGYGDILPTNYLECIFVSILLFFSSIIYVYSISAIGNILTKNSYRRHGHYSTIHET